MSYPEHSSAAIRSARMVGRQAELALLKQKLDRLQAGTGGVVVVSGEAGMGKTRLMEAVAEEAGKLEMRCWRSAATPSRANMDCGLFAEVMEELLRHGSRRHRQSLRQWLATLAPNLPEGLWGQPSGRRLAELEEVPPAWRLNLFCGYLTRVLLEVAQGRPLVLCLEDLHWADEVSLRLLRHLCRRCGGALLVLCTYRPEALGPRGDSDKRGMVAGTLWDLCANLGCESLVLKRLTRAQTNTLVHACFSQAELSGELLERIQEASAGVPLFILQYLSLLIVRGAVRQEGQLWVDQQRACHGVPEAVRDALRHRVRALSPEERHLLGCASVQGVTFEGKLAARAMGWPRMEVLRVLGRLARSTRMIDSCEGGFRFAHGLLCELFYEELAESERRTLHLQVAEVLGQCPGAGAALIARHFSRAGAAELALSHWLAAAREARAAGAYGKAQGWLRQAVEGMEQRLRGGGENKVRHRLLETLLELAQVCERLGEWNQVEECCLAALRWWSPEGGRGVLGRVSMQMGRVRWVKGEGERAERLYREALEYFAGAGDREGSAQSQLALAAYYLDRAALKETAVCLEEARNWALEGDRPLLGETYCRLGQGAMVEGRYLEAMLHYSAALRVCSKANDLYGQGWAYYYIGVLLAIQREWEGALKCCQHSEALARQLGAADLLASTLSHQARALIHTGADAAAQRRCMAARVHVERTGNRRVRAMCDMAEGIVCREQAQMTGRAELREVAAECLQRGRWAFRELGNRFAEAECDLEFGVLRRELGDAEGARRCWAQAAELFGQIKAVGGVRKAEELLAALAA